AAASRPSPGPSAGPRRPRPSSGASVDALTLGVPRPLPFAPSPAAAFTGKGLETTPQPDLSRFLEASKPQPDDDVDETDKQNAGRWRRAFIRTSIIVVIAALAALLLRVFVVQPYYIPSESMEPTLHGCSGCNDDHVLVDKISYRAHSVRTGDIVVFHRPDSADPNQVPESVLIKRVIAVGGDKIAIKNGKVYRNSLVVDETYVKDTKQCPHQSTQPRTARSRWTVPDGDVFVMGDNRCDSIDSRQFGPIPTSSIIGRAFAIIWPLKRVQLLNH
ncbi:MAG TPA: signal peptidase I, partial [Jatrophihabitans sp.]|nr:signal peptidase I [Jatrophihabitans sp.]